MPGPGRRIADRERREQPPPAAALAGRQPTLALGDVVDRDQPLEAPDLGPEAIDPAGVGPQRDDEPRPGPIGGAQAAQVAEGGVGDHDEARRQQRLQAFQGLGERRHLGRRPLVRAEVERDPGGGRRLERPYLAGHPPVRAPALGHEPRATVGAREADARQIEVEPGGIDREPLDGGEQQPAPDVLGARRERVEGATQPIVVEQGGGHPDHLGETRRRRPAGHVVERRGCGEPVGDEGGDHLAVGEQRAAAHRQRAVDELDQAEVTQVVGHDEQRPDLPTAAERRRVEPGEGARPAIELARRLELVEAAERCHNTLTDLAVLSMALHQLHVLVHLAPSPDALHSRVHRWHNDTAPWSRLQGRTSAASAASLGRDRLPRWHNAHRHARLRELFATRQSALS